MNPAFWSPLSADRSLHDRCIISAGTEPHYYESLHSTRLHCAKHDPESWQLFYYGYPDGCPTQKESMYAFKIFAMARAIDAGFRTVLWMDSVFQPVTKMDALWDYIEDHGWYIPCQGEAVLGNWCSDSALEQFALRRDDAMAIPLCYSGLVGLNLQTSIANDIWSLWNIFFKAGTFNGAHTNVQGSPIVPHGHKTMGHCSDDARCHGHRNDEAALSFALSQLGVKPLHNPAFLKMQDEARGIIGHGVKLVCP